MNDIKNNISAINTGAFGLGSILGPILASMLQYLTNYQWAFTINSIFVLIIGII
jgi:MFS family permease